MNEEFARLVSNKAKQLNEELKPLLLPPSEVSPSTEHPVLPISLFKRCNRGYVLKVVHQINLTYLATCYDACSVMIRRLIETLIIEVYEKHNLDSKIKNPNGDFKYLSDLIDTNSSRTYMEPRKK
jgi:hypothetical protein